MAQSGLDPVPNLGRVDLTSSCDGDHERGDDLAVAVVGDADHADVGDGRARQEAVLDFQRVDVLAAADDQIFDAAGDPDVAVRVHLCFVAGLFHRGKVSFFDVGGGGNRKNDFGDTHTCIHTFPCLSVTITSALLSGEPQYSFITR